MDADDFRGVENELVVCEGARVLLTQNLWVEAGLMNGALGNVRGYMWPEGGNPYSERPELRTPLCVFVEFDSVNLGVDEAGRPRSFFPDDPVRRNWVPIFRQKVSSTVEEHVARENFPLQLAWALTHWKAQGMTLDRVACICRRGPRGCQGSVLLHALVCAIRGIFFSKRTCRNTSTS